MILLRKMNKANKKANGETFALRSVEMTTSDFFNSMVRLYLETTNLSVVNAEHERFLVK